MEGLFAYYSKLPGIYVCWSHRFWSHVSFANRIGLAQENIDLNVLSVTITDMCAPAGWQSAITKGRYRKGPLSQKSLLPCNV